MNNTYTHDDVFNIFKLDRSLWQKYIKPMISEEYNYMSWIPMYFNELYPWCFLYDELIPDYNFKYNTGDIVSFKDKYYFIYALPILDSRNKKPVDPIRIEALENRYATFELKNRDFESMNTNKALKYCNDESVKEILLYCDSPEFIFVKHSDIDLSIFDVQ